MRSDHPLLQIDKNIPFALDQEILDFLNERDCSYYVMYGCDIHSVNISEVSQLQKLKAVKKISCVFTEHITLVYNLEKMSLDRIEWKGRGNHFPVSLKYFGTNLMKATFPYRYYNPEDVSIDGNKITAHFPSGFWYAYDRCDRAGKEILLRNWLPYER